MDSDLKTTIEKKEQTIIEKCITSTVSLKQAGRALGHGLRIRIIELLLEKGQQTVTDIYVKLRLEQSVASQHLSILRKSKIVIADRQGKFIYYRVNKSTINSYIKAAELYDELTSK